MSLVIALLFWLDGTFNNTLNGFSWMMIAAFSAISVILFIAPFAFKGGNDTGRIEETFGGPATAPGAASSGARKTHGTLEERMEARRQRVAAARAAQLSEQQDLNTAQAETSEPGRGAGLDRGRLVLGIGTILFLLGVSSMFYLLASHGSPIEVIQSYPLITGLMVLFILSVSWRVSRAIANIVTGKPGRSGSEDKRVPYTEERMARRRERVAKAKREGRL